MTRDESEILSFIFDAARHTPPLHFRAVENQIAETSLLQSGLIEKREGYLHVTELGRKVIGE